MFFKLLLLFTIIPMVELSLLLKLGSYVGFLPTLLLIALTGIVGVSLARKEGFLVVTKIQNSLSRGKMPTDSMIDGLLILIGGVTLLTPGLLTDITGFLLIIPISRVLVRKFLKNRFKGQIKFNTINFNYEQKGNKQEFKEDKYDDNNQWDDLSTSIDVDYEDIEDE